MRKLIVASALALITTATWAGQAKIENVTARQSGGTWTFNVTIRHADTGWDHYADAWTVNTTDGRELGKRILAHPHENEQPFTRSLSGVVIPDGTTEVEIRAHDSVHGWSDKGFVIKLN